MSVSTMNVQPARRVRAGAVTTPRPMVGACAVGSRDRVTTATVPTSPWERGVPRSSARGLRPATRSAQPKLSAAMAPTACGVRRTVWPKRVLLGVAIVTAMTVVAIAQLQHVGAQHRVPAATTLVQVHAGDNLASIAESSVPGGDRAAVISRIQQLNGLPSGAVRAGQSLVVPVSR